MVVGLLVTRNFVFVCRRLTLNDVIIFQADSLIGEFDSSAKSIWKYQQITKYSKKINMRPRKKSEFRTPHECFYELIK